jgi:hypothetical protein
VVQKADPSSSAGSANWFRLSMVSGTSGANGSSKCWFIRCFWIKWIIRVDRYFWSRSSGLTGVSGSNGSSGLTGSSGSAGSSGVDGGNAGRYFILLQRHQI